MPPEAQDGARRYLDSNRHVVGLLRNGTTLGVRVEHAARADVLFGLRAAGVEVVDFWTEAPSMEELLEELLAVDRAHVERQVADPEGSGA